MVNQYRCETCKSHQSHGCDVIGEYLLESETEFTSKVGCVSHSDHQSENDPNRKKEEYSWDWCIDCPRENKCMLNLTFEQCQEISKNVRDKVLKKLEEYIDEFAWEQEGDNGYSQTCISVDHLKKWFIEELRQQAGEL
jgi:hypothetical protein